MRTKLVIFYFVFMLLSIGLFSLENGVTGMEKKSEVKPKKTYKHYSQYSNLC